MTSAGYRSLFVFASLFISLFAAPSAAASARAEKADSSAFTRAREIVAGMSDAEAAAQILLTAVEGSESLSRKSAELLAAVPVGGVMLFKYNLGKGPEAAFRLMDSVRAAVPGSVPPFVAADQEGGSVHRFGPDATKLPSAAAFGAIERKRVRAVAEEAAYRSGRELRALGVTLNLAPVAEVASSASIEFLKNRAYGTDPALVADAASGFVDGMRRAGVACVVKHFPGNSAADPHRARAVIEASGAELDALLSSFRLVFARSAPAAVMVSHAVVSSIDPDRPGTLSPLVVEGLLRKKLKFRGLAVSDDLRMRAISSTGLTPEQAAPLALAAGIDLLMTWPADAASLRDALVAAVSDGTLSRERLREAAARVTAVKIRYGLLEKESSEAGDSKSRAATVAAFKKETEHYLKSVGLR